ncbi:hypothetical protein HYPSUDRAFT_196751 [Hypholoma sublateritium FD-334 SS-4]|uniref:PXA domain-containing protein n=1 Tax=Hypholoma sublateritium (strain FD-334 SS-4) TaxID=945553 RepID=A0A0D2PF51_HYPSF|nr:hypothetical protein HYPSUDRAFT_196751 [Hypholoma sublateritium FD-334 SS-4]
MKLRESRENPLVLLASVSSSRETNVVSAVVARLAGAYGGDRDLLPHVAAKVLVRLLVDDILPKVTQPWFIQSTLLDLVGEPPPPLFAPPPAAAFSYHALVVLALSALQAFSGFCLALIDAYKSTLRLVQHPPPAPPPEACTAPSVASAHSTTSSVSSAPGTLPVHASPAPAYAHAPLLLGALLAGPTPRLAAAATLHTLHVLAALLAPLLDRLLPAALAAFLSPARVLNTVRAGKRAFFPNGYPGPVPPDPTPDEQAALRARVLALRPPPGAFALLSPLLLGPDPAATLAAALDPLSDAHCNLRLAVFLLDRVLVGLFPKLAGAP